MKKIFKIIIVLGVLTGAFFALHTRVLWLDYFDGTIVDKEERSVATVTRKGHAQDISEYFLDIETDSGRKVKMQVDQLLYYRSRNSMRVRKRPFSSRADLSQ
ncbi:MAG TPA: hypothetical protein VM425_20785 [Myxococcota bacterium]|nr:hypothetical protein [Myxococcota bacterium]